MKIRFVTNNENKLKEVQAMLKGFDILPIKMKIKELQTENVKELVKDKLLKAFSKVGRPVFVEHTGLSIESMNGFPGGLTQIFWDKLQADRFSKLFGNLDNTKAIAKTTIGYCDSKNIHFFEGEIHGEISKKPKGDRTFQWDCVFIPNEYDKTFAELGDKKNEISMRKIAFDKFNKFLKKV